MARHLYEQQCAHETSYLMWQSLSKWIHNHEICTYVLCRQLSTLNSFFNNQEVDTYILQLRQAPIVIRIHYC